MKLQDSELAQYGLVSGLWNTMFSVGDILGPTLGGAIIAKLHFNNTMAVFGAVLIILVRENLFSRLDFLRCIKYICFLLACELKIGLCSIFGCAVAHLCRADIRGTIG